jgi:DNA-directed RNA polymerase sigma subunit (sigma70/sigma32)
MNDDDPVRVYLEEMSKVPPMTREEEMECVRHIRARDEHADLAMRDLVEQVLPLVVSIAKRHPSDHIHILDLIQTGNEALLTAVRAFPDSNADDFSVYAEPFIENAILSCKKTIEPQINTDEH